MKTEAKKAIAFAHKCRESWAEYKKGILIIKNDELIHFIESERLPDPNLWDNGTFAIYHDDIIWEKISAGKAEAWKRVYYDDDIL